MIEVLIVDDDAAFRHAAGALLRTRFARVEVREAGNGQEARQQLDGLDLMFIDISLPQENGLELAARIKCEHPELAVAILTIHDAPEYRQAASELGVDYFVSKGDAAGKIAEVVRSVFNCTHPKPTLPL